MTFALVGLILVQFIWIQNAVRIEKRKFDLLVDKSLTEIVQKIAEHETVLSINKETVSFISKDAPYKLSDGTVTQRKLFDSSSKIINNPIFVISKDSAYSKLQNKFEPLDTNTSNSIISQDEKANLIGKLNNKSIFVENIVNKLTRKEIKYSQRIDKKTLELFVNAVFKNNNIDIPYEYAVVKENETKFFNSAGYNSNSNSKTYSKLLFADDVLANDFIVDKYSLIIYFPKSNSIIESLPAIVFTSVILIFFILNTGLLFPSPNGSIRAMS